MDDRQMIDGWMKLSIDWIINRKLLQCRDDASCITYISLLFSVSCRKFLTEIHSIFQTAEENHVKLLKKNILMPVADRKNN